MWRGAGGRQADLVLAALVIAMIAMMIVPLPAAVLDLMIALNFAVAVVLLFVALYVGHALRIASFPTLLLLTTLFRLSIEVSATRLILSRANAGAMIHSFGNFVVAGNLIVGAVVFLILTLIQFVVIAKGSERVAEVAARFTLDALPGQQMAIDAELRAGLLDRQSAHDRRAELTRESQFFGAMDGAMKFVKGDAIAGILVLAINIVGGLAIGMLQRNMDAGTAARTYVLLTVGEGLVAQLPALLISTAAGILVTRVASADEGSRLGTDIARQVLAQPRAIAIAAVLMALLAIVPGLPLAPFLVLAGVLAALAWGSMRAARATRATRTTHAGQRSADMGASFAGATGARRWDLDARATMTPPATFKIDLGTNVAARAVPRGDLEGLSVAWADRASIRLRTERGITLPGLIVRRGDASVSPNGFRLSLDDLPLATGGAPPSTGTGTGDDAMFDAVYNLMGRHAFELVGIQEAQALLDGLRRTHPALIAEVVPKLISLPRFTAILRQLAREGISIAPLRDILGALATAP
ncbi:MAG: flagellar biosynthesis protein FlhA, partial [Pseudomonadota bacterium]